MAFPLFPGSMLGKSQIHHQNCSGKLNRKKGVRNYRHCHLHQHYNVWIRVKFIDLNGTFSGLIERIEKGYKLNKIEDLVTMDIEKVLSIYNPNDGKDWCYSDEVTRCNCPGLCRNK